jgi:hypothetical protein
VKTSRRIFWIGLGIYVISFSLVAVAGPGSKTNPGSRGYWWAWWALVLPWDQIDLWTKAPEILPATAVVGMINPMFVAAIFALVRQYRRTFIVLRIILLLMFPCCMVSFVFMRLHPREGYVLWIIGMVLVLFSNRREQSAHSSSLFKSVAN